MRALVIHQPRAGALDLLPRLVHAAARFGKVNDEAGAECLQVVKGADSGFGGHQRCSRYCSMRWALRMRNGVCLSDTSMNFFSTFMVVMNSSPNFSCS